MSVNRRQPGSPTILPAPPAQVFGCRWAVGLEAQPFSPYNPYVTGRLVEQGRRPRTLVIQPDHAQSKEVS
jgi:hypothetical protein